MSVKEWLIVIIIAPLIVAALLLGGWLLLVGTEGVDFSLSSYFKLPQREVECAEEDFSGVCGVRKFMQGEGASEEVQ